MLYCGYPLHSSAWNLLLLCASRRWDISCLAFFLFCLELSDGASVLLSTYILHLLLYFHYFFSSSLRLPSTGFGCHASGFRIISLTQGAVPFEIVSDSISISCWRGKDAGGCDQGVERALSAWFICDEGNITEKNKKKKKGVCRKERCGRSVVLPFSSQYMTAAWGFRDSV